MSHKIDNDNPEQDVSLLETQDTKLTSKNNSKKTETEPAREVEVPEKSTLTERWSTNRFWLVRGSYHVLRSVWMVAMVIGGFIAWLISLLFI